MSLRDSPSESRRDRFAARVMDALNARGYVGAYVPEDFRIDVPQAGGASPVRVYLGNTFAECEGASPTERDARIANLVTLADPSGRPGTWEEARSALRPVLRQASFGLGLGDPAKVPLQRPAMPLLSELVVIDLPTTMEYVGASRLTEWGVTAEEVFDAARANLAGAARRTSERDAANGPVMMRFVESGDDYFSSLPLVPGWLAAMRGPAGGRPVAFVTEHNGLLVIGVRTPDQTIDALLDMALNDFGEAVRPISPVGYTVDDEGRVVEYDVPAGHPDRAAVRRAQSALIATVYGDQAEALRAEYEADMVDVFVASVIQAASDTDGSVFTISAWTDGIQSSLPRTHYVALGEDYVLVPFDAVVEIAGLRPEEGVYPERYRVGGWPDAETMARLSARAERP